MKHKTGNTIRMMAFEGKSIRQIAEKIDMNIDEIEDYLLSQGIRPTYTAKQGKIENREVKNKVENTVKSGLVEVKDAAAEAAKKKWHESCANPLTDEQKAEIYHAYKSGESMEKIAEKFGKTKSYLYKVCKRMSDKQDTPKEADKPAAENDTNDEKIWAGILETAEPDKELVELFKEIRGFIKAHACEYDDLENTFEAGVLCGRMDKALEKHKN